IGCRGARVPLGHERREAGLRQAVDLAVGLLLVGSGQPPELLVEGRELGIHILGAVIESLAVVPARRIVRDPVLDFCGLDFKVRDVLDRRLGNFSIGWRAGEDWRDREAEDQNKRRVAPEAMRPYAGASPVRPERAASPRGTRGTSAYPGGDQTGPRQR